MSQNPVNFSSKEFFSRMAKNVWQCVSSGYTVLVLLMTALLKWAGIGSLSNMKVLGLAFQLCVVFFFVWVGLSRSLREIPSLSAVGYRLFHFLLSTVGLFLFFFVVWPPLSEVLGESATGTLNTGDVNWAFIILAFVVFLAAYFATVGLRAALRGKREKRRTEEEEYKSMLERRKKRDEEKA